MTTANWTWVRAADTDPDAQRVVDDVIRELGEVFDDWRLGPDPISGHSPDDLPCQVNDAELWFAERPDLLERAKSYCAPCVARRACLAGAIDRNEPWGVWGGEIFQRGAIIAHKRPRGRQRGAGSPP